MFVVVGLCCGGSLFCLLLLLFSVGLFAFVGCVVVLVGCYPPSCLFGCA